MVGWRNEGVYLSMYACMHYQQRSCNVTSYRALTGDGYGQMRERPLSPGLASIAEHPSVRLLLLYAHGKPGDGPRILPDDHDSNNTVCVAKITIDCIDPT